jgi:hypothetical protein
MKKGYCGTKTASIKPHTVKPFMRSGKSIKGYEVKAHTRQISVPLGDIQARQFLKLQTSDVAYFKKSVAKFITRDEISGSAGEE